MIIGIRVEESENIQTEQLNIVIPLHNGFKDKDGKNRKVPGLILQFRRIRFINCLKQISLKKKKDRHEEVFDYTSKRNIG
jgi:hypothetical protein